MAREESVGGMFATLAGGKKKKKNKAAQGHSQRQAEEAAKDPAPAEQVNEPVKSPAEATPSPAPASSGSWAQVAKKKAVQKPAPAKPAPEPTCDRDLPPVPHSGPESSRASLPPRPRKATGSAVPARREQVRVGSAGSSGTETTEWGLTSDEEEGWTFVLRPEDDWEIVPDWPTLPDARTCLKGWF